MKIQEIRQLDEARLKEKVVDLKKAIMGLNFQRATGQLEKTHQYRQFKKDIARIKTILAQQVKAS